MRQSFAENTVEPTPEAVRIFPTIAEILAARIFRLNSNLIVSTIACKNNRSPSQGLSISITRFISLDSFVQGYTGRTTERTEEPFPKHTKRYRRAL